MADLTAIVLTKNEEKNLPEAGCHAAFVKKGNLVIELYQNDPEAVKEAAARKDGHIDHLALNVQDVKAAFEEMKASGCTMLDQEIQSLPFYENGVAWFTVLGPNGERVEFNQYL